MKATRKKSFSDLSFPGSLFEKTDSPGSNLLGDKIAPVQNWTRPELETIPEPRFLAGDKMSGGGGSPPQVLTVADLSEAARILRAAGRQDVAEWCDYVLTNGRPAAVKLLPPTRKKRRPRAAGSPVERRRMAWLALRDRLDPDHAQAAAAIHATIDGLLTAYLRDRWQFHKDLDAAPPRGATNCDDLLWRLCRIEGLKTIRIGEKCFRNSVKAVLTERNF